MLNFTDETALFSAINSDLYKLKICTGRGDSFFFHLLGEFEEKLEMLSIEEYLHFSAIELDMIKEWIRRDRKRWRYSLSHPVTSVTCYGVCGTPDSHSAC